MKRRRMDEVAAGTREQHGVNETCVQTLNENTEKRHLPARAFKHVLRVAGLAAQTVRRPDHRHVADIHLGDSHVLWPHKHLQTASVS